MESVLCGLEHTSQHCTMVAIHDGARPLVSQRIINDTIKCARTTGAAAPAIPVKDTIKEAENAVVINTPKRDALFCVQTPQCFDRDLIQAALLKARKDNISLTDDCMAVEQLGMKVHLTTGSNQNIKITTPSDLWIADGILQGRKKYCASDMAMTFTD